MKLSKREGRKIYVSGLDAIDGTPVIDIKPRHEGVFISGRRSAASWVCRVNETLLEVVLISCY